MHHREGGWDSGERAVTLRIVPVGRGGLCKTKVGNTMAVMLGFVLLSFFSSDSWHAAGTLSWQRFISLLVIFVLCALPVLYRQSSHLVKGALKTPIRTDGIAQSVKDPLVKEMVTHMAGVDGSPGDATAGPG